jgi:D-cysteine desulfhydrase
LGQDSAHSATASGYALFERFPKLAVIPRASLCTLPSPVQSLASIADDLWIKRDDLDAPVCGGNKVRALEFLLGGLGEGDAVVTAGGAGSTHVLATAVHATRIGVRTIAMRWKHEMNPVADAVSSRIPSVADSAHVSRSAVVALSIARYRAITGRLRYIPIGGSTPLGILGHVNAALELAEQIRRGEMPVPRGLVIPVASGGTAAGLMLGLAVARLDIEIIGARVGPRLFVNRRNVLALARKTSDLIASVGGVRPPRFDPSRLVIAHDVYAGAYGRALPRASSAAAILHDAAGIRLDDTYSGKAWVAALDRVRTTKGPILFWLTFDPSCLTR